MGEKEKARKRQYNNTKKLFKKLMKSFATPPSLTVSQWADAYRMLSPESSAEAGKWRTDRAPYQREIMDAVSDEKCYKVVIMSSAQIGKALDISTPIPTADGWKQMGEIKVGDIVFDENGKQANVVAVTEVMEDRPCYEVTFSDGAKIVADENHEWCASGEILTTKEIAEVYIEEGIYRYTVPATKSLETLDKELLASYEKIDKTEREIISVEKIENRSVRCIQVDSESHLYLAGREMIPTHNSEIILNMIGYHIDYDPAPIMYVLPTETMAETFSKDRVSPMIRDTPSLKDKVDDSKSRSSGNTIYKKQFKGGHLTFVGANAPSNLASRPIRILLADEIDRFPDSAGAEGDPLQLAIKRTTTFWNRKIIEVSTPTIKGVSKIEKEYESSSMEHLNVACPFCGKYQTYEWEQLKFEHEKGTKDFHLLGYKCRFCDKIGKETVWKRQPIKWIAEHPEVKDIRGFHLNEMASPWKRWEEIVADFLEAKRQGREMLKVWRNTSLGLTWEEDGDLDIKDILLRRRKQYNCVVPKDVVVLTCGVDTQDNRLEYEIVGWGRDKQSWGIKYGVLMGDAGKEDVWKMLDDVIFAEYEREDGLKMQVMTTCVDSGGHYTSEVYAYCKKREMRRVWAIKGQGGSGVSYIQRPTKRNKSGAWLFIIGVDVGKDTMASRLKTEFEYEAGYCFFPIEADRGYDEQYFTGLTAEKRNIRTINGRVVINWVKKYEGIRNEPFDIRNYATAALEILNPNLERLYERQKNPNTAPVQAETKRKKGKVSKGVSIYG